MTHHSKATIAIIGSAIAGLSAAIAVARAGHNALIFGDMPKALGGALQLAPNGYDALASLDLMEIVSPHITRLDAIEIRSARSNHCLATIHHDRPKRRDYGAIGRDDLATSLYQAAMSYDAITFCKDMVASIDCSAETTALTTTSGARYSCDLIIGADGKNGLARRVMDGTADTERAERVALRASCPADALPRRFHAKRTQLWLGNGYHLVSYPFYDRRLDEMRINLVLCTTHSNDEAHAITYALFGQKAVLAPLADKAITWHKTPLLPAGQLTSWRKNGLVLFGDSAHVMPPHLAQGAGQTLEDAASLQIALAGAGTLTQAAANWALQRQRALRPIIERAEATGMVMRLTGPLAMVRNAAVEFGGQPLIEKWLSEVWQ